MTTQVREKGSFLMSHKKSAARTIIDKMDDPGTLLTFLTNAIEWVSDFDACDPEKKKKAINLLTVWINEITHPWAFDKTRDTPEEIVGCGIDCLFDYFDYKEYEQICADILGAFANMLSHSTPNIVSYQVYAEGMNVLMLTGFDLYYFELARKEQKA